MLDLAALRDAARLPERYKISSQDLKRCCDIQGSRIPKGTVVLVRTGYGRFWSKPETYDNAAGVSLEATRWLLSKKVNLVGADNLAWEVYSEEPDAETGDTLPCHARLLVDVGYR